MNETGQVERAARRAIGLAKRRGDDEVGADDLLLGALEEISRFGIAWIGERAVDLRALCGEDREPAGGGAGPAAAAPAYGQAVVELFERAAALAREEGSGSTGLVHLLAVFADVSTPLRDRLFARTGLSAAQWRAELARGVVGSPPRLAGGADGASVLGGAAAPGGPEILGVEDAAEYLGVHSQTVRNYIRSGKLPAYRLAGERFLRVLRKDLLALLERVPSEGADESDGGPSPSTS